MEPQNITEGQSDWQNLFATVYIEVLLYQSYFSYNYFTITWVKKIVCYTEVL